MPIRELKFRIRIIVEKDENGFYAYCPELKGLLVGGSTKAEIHQNVPDCRTYRHRHQTRAPMNSPS